MMKGVAGEHLQQILYEYIYMYRYETRGGDIFGNFVKLILNICVQWNKYVLFVVILSTPLCL